jgi:transcription antitermination factor NusG
VLQTSGVVSIISFCGKPVPVPDWEITNLKIIQGTELPVTHEEREFTAGETVHITRGTLQGLRGIIVHIKGRQKLVISISALNYNLSIDIDPAFVEKVTSDE